MAIGFETSGQDRLRSTLGAGGKMAIFAQLFFTEKHKIRPDGHFLRVLEKYRRGQKWRGKAPGHSQHSGIVKIRTFFFDPNNDQNPGFCNFSKGLGAPVALHHAIHAPPDQYTTPYH